MATSSTDSQVLIVGGGPVGLGLAVELGLRGIKCLLVEQGDGTIYFPRANTVNSRTMEFCRRWGVADDVRNSGTPPGYPSDVVYLTSLQGYEIARITRPTYGGIKPLATTPEQSQRCNQLWFDPILRKLASSLPTVTLRYRCRFESCDQDNDHVTATVRDLETDRIRRIDAQYLVACCGGQSSVPNFLGVRMEGTRGLSYNLNIFLKIPEFSKYHDKGKAGFYQFSDGETFNAILIELDGNELWNLTVNLGTKPVASDSVDVPELIRRLLGPDTPYELVSVLPWTCHSIVATSFGLGRVQLAGDAGHQHAPTGGFGMNVGIGDATNLGWKLAAVLNGWGGKKLIESYEAERRPVAQRFVSEATENLNHWFNPALLRIAGDDSDEGSLAREKLRDDILNSKTKHFVSDGLVLGYRYDPSPIIVPDGSPPPVDSVSQYVPTSRPGSRAPHGWLSEEKSTLDLFGRGFVLIRFGVADDESRGLEAAAAHRDVPIEVVDVPSPDIAALYERRLVLVRPDGHVAWRSDAAPDDPLRLIDTVRGALLGNV